MNLDDSIYRKYLFLFMNIKFIYWFKKKKDNKNSYMNSLFKFMEDYIKDEKIKSKNLKSFVHNIIKKFIKESTEAKLYELFSINNKNNNWNYDNINIIIPNSFDWENFIKFCQINNVNFLNCNLYNLYKNYYEHKKCDLDIKTVFENYKKILKDMKDNKKMYELNKVEEKNLTLKEFIDLIKKLNLKDKVNHNPKNKYKKLILANKAKRLLKQILLKLDWLN